MAMVNDGGPLVFWILSKINTSHLTGLFTWYEVLWQTITFREYTTSVWVMCAALRWQYLCFFQCCRKSTPFILSAYFTCLSIFCGDMLQTVAFRGCTSSVWKCDQRCNKCCNGSHFFIFSKINTIYPIDLFYMPIKFCCDMLQTVTSVYKLSEGNVCSVKIPLNAAMADILFYLPIKFYGDNLETVTFRGRTRSIWEMCAASQYMLQW